METRIKKKYVLKKQVKHFLNKCLFGIVIFLVGMITVKNNPSFKEMIKKNVYEKSISFLQNRKTYEKYLGSIIPKKEKEQVEQVSSNIIPYEKKEKIENGIKLTVKEKTPIPLLESGVVVYIGEKENYGNIILVEQVDGIETIYSNIDFHNIKLYDYIEKNQIIGESKERDIILLFQKNGEFIDYQKNL